MAICKIQGNAEKQQGIYYEFDSSDEPLGVGGMGKVYKGLCINEITGQTKKVAIKFMYSDLPPHAIERARREASIRIKNENLVEMLGFIETEETNVLGEITHRYHVVSELLEGVMLDDLLQGNLNDRYGNPVPFAQKLYSDFQKDVYHFAINIIRNVVSGLMALHDAGYLHRDIDPTNIMVTTDGHIKLIDFGIAKQRRSLTTNDKSLTVAGVFMGKPEYAAPELVLGDIKSQDQTTDIYSVGILMFQCLVGHPPFEGDRHEVLHSQLHQKLPLNLIKNKDIRKIVEKATEKSRSKRFQSAAEFRVALDHLPSDLSKSSFEWKKSYTIAASIVAVMIVGASAVSMIPSKTDDPEPPSPTEVSQSGYQSAVALLRDGNTAKDGVAKLETLSKDGDSEASYLLSRLLFKSEAAQDYCPDSIVQMQSFTGMTVDNAKAHQLLELAVKQDSTNYRALFELASDYFGGSSRASEYNRNTKQALQLFYKALEHAQKDGNAEYIQRSQTNIQKLEAIMK